MLGTYVKMYSVFYNSIQNMAPRHMSRAFVISAARIYDTFFCVSYVYKTENVCVTCIYDKRVSSRAFTIPFLCHVHLR